MKYNKIITTFVVLSLIVPQFMFAVSSTTPANGNKVAGQNFCANLDRFITNSEKKLFTRQENKNDKIAERISIMEKRREENDKKVTEKRAEALSRQDARFTELMNKASTTAQKIAITEFQEAVKNAVSARQTAIDSAKNAYREGVDNLVTDRKTKTDEATKVMKDAINSAIAKAKTDCANGVDSVTVRNTLQTAIKEARDTFKATIQNLGKIGDKIEVLNQTRKTAFEKAQNDFKTALENAKSVLKTKLSSI